MCLWPAEGRLHSDPVPLSDKREAQTPRPGLESGSALCEVHDLEPCASVSPSAEWLLP